MPANDSTIIAAGNAGSTSVIPAQIVTWFQPVSQWLTRRRIAVSIVVVVALVAEDILLRERPHAIANFTDLFSVAGLALVVSGVLMRSWAAGFLHKNVALATSGPYSITRNPLYLGSLLMTLGFCALIGDLDNALAMITLALLVYWPKIRNEEAYLASAFGDVWHEYARRTPRLFPHRALVDHSFARWRGSQWLANREYNAVAGTCFGLLALQAWHMWPF
jgi:protein-S-isoprenylcysteine O-methyltransferase Ste14